jgi:Uma2 family endonuclease
MLLDKLAVQLDFSEIVQLVHLPTVGHILAIDVSEEDYMRDYAEMHCEWVDGVVIKMSPVVDKHDAICRYLSHFLDAYIELNPIAELRQDPFVMRYQFEADGKIKKRNREPDLQIILKDNPNTLNPSFMDGAADIVIEVVSLESVERDYGIKYHEYETIGVREYWIVDPLKKEARFYRLNDKKAYILQDVEDTYTSPILPRLKIHIPIFWQASLPRTIEVGKMVTKMLEE